MLSRLNRLLDAPAQAKTLRDKIIEALFIVPIVTVMVAFTLIALRVLGVEL